MRFIERRHKDLTAGQLGSIIDASLELERPSRTHRPHNVTVSYAKPLRVVAIHLEECSRRRVVECRDALSHRPAAPVLEHRTGAQPQWISGAR